ncbi:MAG: FAD:protein FMN transferase, partial [Methylomonas sp.]|nr:FAD:protein FMN transferase [Methylomonas sp.]
MKKMTNMKGLLLGLLVLAACDQPAQIVKFEGFAQGTTYHVSYWAQVPVDAKALEAEVTKEFADIDKTLSNYRPDSVIEGFNDNPTAESQFVGSEIVELFEIASRVSQASLGCYDLTFRPLFDLWGFQGESLTIPDPVRLQKALAEVGMEKIVVVDDTHLQKPPKVRVDVSSVAQGYSVEKISRILERQDIHNYLVEVGGELKTHGHKPDGS